MSLIVLAMVKSEKGQKSKDSPNAACVWETNSPVNTSIASQEKVKGDVEWDEDMIPLVLSSFSWGYLTSQIIGGRLAEIFGFKKIYGFGIFIPGLLFLLHPVAARVDAYLFLVFRMLVGVAEGVTWPAMHSLTARWVPPSVRSSWVSKTYFGSTFGSIITYPMCGIIIDQFGWEPCFYVIAAITSVWAIFWYFLVYDDPHSHPRISQEELQELSEIQVSVKRPPVPWLEIIKSPAVWGTLITDCGNTFGIVIFLGMGPVFFKYMLGLNIKSNGLLSALPMVGRYVGGVSIAYLSDWLIASNKISRLNARRLFNTLSQAAPAIALVLLGYSGCNVTAAIVLKVAGMFFNCIGAGHFVSMVDLAPNYAGTLLGISNTAAGGGMSALAPLVAGYFTTKNHTWEAWQTVFWITAAVYIFANFIYVLTIRAKPQPWNEPKTKDEENQKEKQTNGMD